MPTMDDISSVNQFIETSGIKWITVNFLDMLGSHRSISLPATSFTSGSAWDGVDFDGSSIGLAAVERSDMQLVPDARTIIRDPFH